MSRRSKARKAPEEPVAAADCPAESCPACEPAPDPSLAVGPPAEAPAAPQALEVQPAKGVPRQYPSLYDSTGTTMVAVAVGLALIFSIQIMVSKIAKSTKSDHVFLTRFVTSLVALVVGAYIADTLIAGPDTSLLSDDERMLVLHFLKDTCLMVFAYYFGLKAQVPPPEPPDTAGDLKGAA